MGDVNGADTAGLENKMSAGPASLVLGPLELIALRKAFESLAAGPFSSRRHAGHEAQRDRLARLVLHQAALGLRDPDRIVAAIRAFRDDAEISHVCAVKRF